MLKELFADCAMQCNAEFNNKTTLYITNAQKGGSNGFIALYRD
jgi:hypothetical protein